MQSTIIKNRRLQSDYFEVKFLAPEIAEKAVAGQFVHVRIDERGDQILRRPFSIHSTCPEEGTVSVAYKVVGKGTRAMSALAPGYEFDVMGPLGRGFSSLRSSSSRIFGHLGQHRLHGRTLHSRTPPP